MCATAFPSSSSLLLTGDCLTLIEYVRTILGVLPDDDDKYLDALWIAPVRISSAMKTDSIETRAGASLHRGHLISFPLMAFVLEMMQIVVNHGVNSNLLLNPPHQIAANASFIKSGFSAIHAQRFWLMFASEYGTLKKLMGEALLDTAWWHAKVPLQRLELWAYDLNWISPVR